MESAVQILESEGLDGFKVAALAERWASVRTSVATTANPRPCSPARAASTAAFKAKILVWNAILSITLMILPVSVADFEDFCAAEGIRITRRAHLLGDWKTPCPALPNLLAGYALYDLTR